MYKKLKLCQRTTRIAIVISVIAPALLLLIGETARSHEIGHTENSLIVGVQERHVTQFSLTPDGPAFIQIHRIKWWNHPAQPRFNLGIQLNRDGTWDLIYSERHK